MTIAIFLAPDAMAADMAVKAPLYKAPPAPVVTWTGCYVGGNVGAGWAKNHTYDPGFVPTVDVGTNTGSGVVGGLQAGCDYQWGNWVFGGRALVDWTDDLHGSNGVSSAALATGGYTPNELLGQKTQWFGTLTARAGYQVAPQLLLYVDGGAAWVRKRYTDADLIFVPPYAGQASETRNGWTIGGGVEYKLQQNWSVFAEYDYIGLDNHNVTLNYVSVGSAPYTYTYNFKQNVQTVLFGANYRFGGPF